MAEHDDAAPEAPLPAPPAELPPPTPARLNALFRRARFARLYHGGLDQDRPLNPKPLSKISGERLRALHRALRIPEQQEPLSCSCLGDFTIELASGFGHSTFLALHYHRQPQLSYKGWSHDARLNERSTVLKFLRKCGLGSALSSLEDELQAEEFAQKVAPMRRFLAHREQTLLGPIFDNCTKQDAAKEAAAAKAALAAAAKPEPEPEA